MEVSTNTEISYSLRLTPTEARKLHAMFCKIAHSNSSIITVADRYICKDLAACLKNEVLRTEGTDLTEL